MISKPALRWLGRRHLWLPWRVVVALGLLVGLAGLVTYSPSPSLPPGWYVRALGWRAVRVGDVVVLEMPEVLQGTVPAWYTGHLLLKEVAGLEGTRVCWRERGMAVEMPGQIREYLIPPMPPMAPQVSGCRTLAEGEMVLVGSHVRSVDSRFVGPVEQKLIKFRVWPVWTREDGA